MDRGGRPGSGPSAAAEGVSAVNNVQRRMAALWVFVVLNYLYCDVLALMNPVYLRQVLAGQVGAITMSEDFLLAAAVLMEIPMAMVLVTRVAGYRVNRTANLAAGALMTLVQAATLALGAPPSYYLFFSTIEIAGTAAIVRCAWTWRPAPILAVPAGASR